jgi:phospholipid/cholesterol/gamma-HCH transport system substrate-binding protein
MQRTTTVIGNMKQGEGTAGMILTDTLFRKSLYQSIINVEEGTERFNENMEALRSNFLFRKYFKKLDKEKKNAANTTANKKSSPYEKNTMPR